MIYERFKKFINKNRLIDIGDTILLAFSGGVDSVFLFHLLNQIKEEYKLSITLFHLNHNLRGSESLRDENFCKNFANKHNVEIFIKSVDIKAIALEQKTSIEQTGREVRYSLLKKTAEKFNFSKIATAHHCNDQIETFFIKLFSGNGVMSFSGIRIKDNKIIRPILNFTKEEIITFVKRHHLQFVNDSSNQSNIYLRNRIRNILIPEIEKHFGSSFKNNILKFMNQINSLNLFINDYIDIFFENNLYKEEYGHYFERNSLPHNNFLRIEIYKKFFSLYGVYDYRQDNLNTLDSFITSSNSSGRFIFKDIVFFKEYNRIFICKREKLPKKAKKVSFTIKEIRKANVSEYLDKKNCAVFDAEKVYPPLFIRYFKEGDRFTPLGMSSSLKLKDFFINSKIPVRKRRIIPLLVDKNDEIIWVIPYRISDRVKITEKTKKFLKCEISFIE